jgi:hypothetical protein
MRPILVVNPADDAVFAAFAQVLLDHGATSVRELEHRLQAVYPAAAVHARELSAEPFVIWYVYRHGHWVASRPVADTPGAHVDHEDRSPARPSRDGAFHSEGRRTGQDA